MMILTPINGYWIGDIKQTNMKLPYMKKCTLSYICGIIGVIIVLLNDIVTAYQRNYDLFYPNEALTANLPTDKRYAMLSYSFRPESRYGYRRRYRPYRKHYSYSQYKDKPWLKLPDKWCFRQSCSSSNDCCMKHNICDVSAKRCIDCWYGYPCKHNADCCDRFPRCDYRTKSCRN